MTTPLFAGVKTPSTFFGTVLEPVDVAKEIIGAIDAGMSGELAMPLYARWIPLLHVLPVSVQRLIRAGSGLDRAMQTFIGRSKETQMTAGKETRETS